MRGSACFVKPFSFIYRFNFALLRFGPFDSPEFRTATGRQSRVGLPLIRWDDKAGGWGPANRASDLGRVGIPVGHKLRADCGGGVPDDCLGGDT